jgi:DNA-binding response OmpR family regulator
MLTPKDINFLLRDYAMKQGMEQINYTNFAADLYMARFELADSRVMDINMDKLDKIIIDECNEASDNGKTITITQLRHVLYYCKQLTLTPF